MGAEDGLNPGEKILTEYYLETLITDAFKGKGFQKISELFENKVVCSSQRHSKVLLNQLDRLINKIGESYSSFCENPKKQPTLEFLKICKESSAIISSLVEDFFDTTLVICKCESKDGVKQLLDTFLFTLGFIIMQKWPPYHVRLEAVKTINFILDQTSREEKKKLNSSEEVCTLMQALARELFDVGDYNIQVTITEALCRMTTKKLRENFAQKWFEDSFFAEAFKGINDKDFETDCRKFLNSVNSTLEETIRVHTFPCISVSTDMGELTKPQDDKLEHFWIDFNVGSQGISFYIHQNKDYLWESVRLQKESLSGYSLEECSGQKLLSIHLQIPHCIDNKEVKYIMIKFELEHDIQNAVIKTYGEDLQMKVHVASLQKDDKLQAGLTDSQNVVCIGEQESASVVSDTARILESTEENKHSEVSSKNSISTTSETRRHSLKQHPSEKKSVDIFDFPKSSESPSDIEVSVVKEDVASPMASCSSRRRTQSCQITEAKKAGNNEDSGSDMSWILEYRRKPSISADYSRKRQRRKSRLKVLPLSSQSSDEQKDSKKKGQPLKFTGILKGTREGKGVAESLSFSELNLPGISGLLTPRHSNPQTSGTLHLSDLDEDTMDPVQEMSSPEMIKLRKPSQSDTTSRMEIENSEDPLGNSKEGNPSGKDEVLKNKRKRSSNEDEEEFTFKPRKLFTSATVSADMEDDVFKSDSHESDITEYSFISSFENFTEGLKKKMMTRYKRMEVRAQHVLTTSHLHVSNLMNQIQQSNFRKLDHFRTIVAQELSSLETETQALKELEKETLDFWEAQTVKMNEFCTSQQQRIEAMDRMINESLSTLKKKEETTDIIERL